jgi:hypothetical protein
MVKIINLIIFIIFFAVCGCNSNKYEIKASSNSKIIIKLDKTSGDTWLYTSKGWKIIANIEISVFEDNQKVIDLVKYENAKKHKSYLEDEYSDTYFMDSGWHSKKIDGDIYLVKHTYSYLDSVEEMNSRGWIYEVHLNNEYVRHVAGELDSVYSGQDQWANYEYSEN